MIGLGGRNGGSFPWKGVVLSSHGSMVLDEFLWFSFKVERTVFSLQLQVNFSSYLFHWLKMILICSIPGQEFILYSGNDLRGLIPGSTHATKPCFWVIVTLAALILELEGCGLQVLFCQLATGQGH